MKKVTRLYKCDILCGMKISLLISTYNWAEALELVLLSAIRQSLLPDEILIADDGSGESTRALIDSMRSQTTVPIHHIWHEDQGYRKTTIVNKAIEEATGDYIIQVDGDVILHKHFIHDHCAFSAPNRFIRGYRIHLNKAQAAHTLEHKIIDFPLVHHCHTIVLKAIRFPLLSSIFRRDRLDCRRVYGCNLSFWRADAIKVNGYNNDFFGWGNDDQEFASRLVNIGIKRRKVRFALKQWHIYHPESSREMESKNKELLQHTMKSKATYCTNGIVQDYHP